MKSKTLSPTFSRKILLALCAGVLGMVLSGCGNTSETGGGASTPDTSGNTSGAAPHAMQAPPTTHDKNTLVIVSPHSDSIREEFENAWKKKHPEASIQWLNPGASSELLRFVLDQYKSKKKPDEGIGVDLFFGGGLESFVELDDQKLLEKLPSDYKVPVALNGVPLRAANGDWVGAALSGFGILYNKKIAARDKLPVPNTWADLGKKELQGRIELADPRKSGSAHVAYEIILQTNGWENGWKILTAMAGNARAFIDSSSTLVNDVSSGEAVFVPSIDFYARAKINEAGKDKAGYIEPKNQSVVTPDPIGILRGAQNQKLAQEFVAFVMSSEGQKLWMLDKGTPGGPQENALFRMAILPSLYAPIAKGSLISSNPFSVKNARAYDFKKAAARRQVLDDLIGATLIDNHDALVGRQKNFGDLNQMMLAPSEDDVMQAAKQWNDAEYSQKKLTAWRAAARTKIS